MRLVRDKLSAFKSLCIVAAITIIIEVVVDVVVIYGYQPLLTLDFFSIFFLNIFRQSHMKNLIVKKLFRPTHIFYLLLFDFFYHSPYAVELFHVVDTILFLLNNFIYLTSISIKIYAIP